ncbi:(2Fe-2S) ferredoxin [Microlunatus endophyticus]|uniref:(2Fe-2S) ferredoxin n=1 Tax=Microlunatus endophyticus TaxID=1716077 RepID=A0A917S6V0_9ACTN|nr:DUF5914 domain-containing protein [Microlunatus endophyticus]GGL61760.1 (2Fe-2S) ferredoxin [Microlunatus endophyticus]
MTIRPSEQTRTDLIRRTVRSRVPIRLRPQPGYDDLRPTWREAKPARIRESLRLSQERSAGGWYVVGRSEDLGHSASIARVIAGREITLWRSADGGLRAGPGGCPHLGALLDGCPVLEGNLVCRWHGLMLGDAGYGNWKPYAAQDDGALLWARVPPVAGDGEDLGTDPDGDRPTAAPVVGDRPPLAQSVSAVITRRGRCEPVDIMANRLDPWHGAWFHPYSFSHLRVDDDASTPERLAVDVTFRLGHRLGVPVRAEFVCPDRRTIVMRIIDGEGVGSVVETHATPITGPGDPQPETVMTELTVAYSDRPGFVTARRLAGLLRPAMRHVARRLWVDDLVYAERRYALRCRGEFPG